MAKAKDLNPNIQREIIQIIPADGWTAEMHYDEKGGTFRDHTIPLVCWSLVTEKQMLPKPRPSSVVGMIAGEKGQIVFADFEEGFYKYERSR